MPELAAELAKLLRDFLYRDTAFITGGATVILTVLLIADRFPRFTTRIPAAQVFYLACLSYVVGYAIQDLFALIRVVWPGAHIHNGCFLQWLVARYAGEPRGRFAMNDIAYKRLECTYVCLSQADANTRSAIERIIDLRQVSSVMGSSLLFSSLLLLVSAIRHRAHERLAIRADVRARRHRDDSQDATRTQFGAAPVGNAGTRFSWSVQLLLSIAGFCLALLLIATSWVKSVQQANSMLFLKCTTCEALKDPPGVPPDHCQ